VKALIFDCDGVLVDTERDGHRVAFNAAFAKLGIAAEWSVAEYGELLKIAGGKERMRAYFDKRGWPAGDPKALIQKLHETKTALFMEIIEAGKLPLRPGVARIVDEAIAAGLLLAVCSTSNEKAVTRVVERMLGAERREHFSAILAGDIVAKKKPDPAIYLLAMKTLHIAGNEGVVVEDSRNGLLAAKGAGFKCLVTKSSYTPDEDFTEADKVVEELGDRVTVKELMSW
jgi:HAD superfamily hydrolase (TIGR01509 family)